MKVNQRFGSPAGASYFQPRDVGREGFLFEAKAQGGLAEDAALVGVKADLGQFLRVLQRLNRVAEDRVGAFDHLVQDVAARVADLDRAPVSVRHRQAVEADEAEQTSVKLIGGRAVVGVEEGDFRVAVADLRSAGQIAKTAEAQEVLGEGALLDIAGAANLHLDRDEAFLLEARQQLVGGDHLELI